MKSAVLRVLTISTLVLSIGFHWAFLQTVAWAGMLARYAQDTSFTVALEKTFNGQNPCSICKIIEKGRETESQHQNKEGQVVKLDFFVPFELLVFHYPALVIDSTDLGLIWSSAGASPPSPPPRLV